MSVEHSLDPLPICGDGVNGDVNNKRSDTVRETESNARALDEIAAMQPLLRNSACLRCADHRTIVSGKGSVFMLCQSTATPKQWPKYPPQPVRQCGYFR
jgi:hypothetical protein